MLPSGASQGSRSVPGYGNQSEDDYLVDATVTKLAKIPHVKSVSPILETDVNLKQGVYQGYSNIVGMPREELEQIPLAEGKLPDKNAATLEFIGRKYGFRQLL